MRIQGFTNSNCGDLNYSFNTTSCEQSERTPEKLVLIETLLGIVHTVIHSCQLCAYPLKKVFTISLGIQNP